MSTDANSSGREVGVATVRGVAQAQNDPGETTAGVVLSMVSLAPVRLVVVRSDLAENLVVDDVGTDGYEELGAWLRAGAIEDMAGGAGVVARAVSEFGGWFVLSVPVVIGGEDEVARLVLAKPEEELAPEKLVEAKVLADVIAMAFSKKLGEVNQERRIYLEELVRRVAEECMGATKDSLAVVYTRVIRLLGEEFKSDVAFLRRHNYEDETSVLIAEWPVLVMPNGEDHPLGVVAFDSDPVFMVTRDLKRPLFGDANTPDVDAVQAKIERASGVPGVAACAVPLLMGEHTWGIIGFLHFELHTWLPAEINALTSVAALLTQLQARFDAAFEASHDDLTGMHNRRALLAELDSRLERGESAAVMVIDLDRFKVMNDFLGHAQGDRLLVAMAERVFSNTRPGDFAGRLGGDEFVFVVGGDAKGEEALGLAGRMLKSLGEPTSLGDQSVSHTASIGVAVAELGMSSLDVLAAADVAMYAAKNAGGNKAALYNDEMRERVNKRSQIEIDLTQTMRRGGLVVWYQPEMDLVSGEIVGMEALVRWRRGDHLVAAGEFIEVAEEAGLIVELDSWVLAEACRQMRVWSGVGKDLTLRVNVSPASLRRDNFVEEVARTLSDSGLEAGALCLEVTEHVIVLEPEKTAGVLNRLREMGISIAIDDFGTGFASLAGLKNLPADFLKLDIGFVRGIVSNRFDRAIVESVIYLSGALGMDVVAEGVETQDIRDELVAMGCRRAQGWLFHPALEACAMGALLGVVE